MNIRSQPGYYPGFRTLDQQKVWDAKTREVILDRVHRIPEIRFFSPDQALLMEAICGHILPQDDRDVSHRIPIVPQIDKRLFEDKGNGYRYEDSPPDRDAYRLGLEAVQQTSVHLHGRGFPELSAREQGELLERLHDGDPATSDGIWTFMPLGRFWTLLCHDCISAYYAHPWAWDEIGFGGPAYPRAYMRLENGEAEPWESEERRYEWSAPEIAVSNKFISIGSKSGHSGFGGAVY